MARPPMDESAGRGDPLPGPEEEVEEECAISVCLLRATREHMIDLEVTQRGVAREAAVQCGNAAGARCRARP
jgi:hypothetical protein